MGIEKLTEDSNDLGEITPEELKRNNILRAKAAARRAKAEEWRKNEGAEILAHANAPGAKGPQPQGVRITPEELARAMGARIIRRVSRRSFP